MTEPGRSSFLKRTLHNLRSGWQAIAGSTYDAAAASMRPDLPGDDAERLERQMRACLASRGGESPPGPRRRRSDTSTWP